MYTYFFFLGFISITSQAVILREIVNITYGNEIFYSIGLGLWLLFTSLGSWLGRKYNGERVETRCNNPRRGGPMCPPALYLTLALLYLPLFTIAVRALIASVTITGELPPLLYSLAITAVGLSVPCLTLGYLFTAGARIRKAKLNKAYFAETLGIFAGGIVFSFILAQTSFPLTAGLNKKTLKPLYHNIKQVINSKQQQIVATKEGNQTNIYLSGQRAISTGQKMENEQLAGLVLSYTNEPDSILTTGNPNLANFFSKNTNTPKVNYVESDQQLFKIIKQFLNNGVTAINSDIVNHLKAKEDSYNLIFLDLPQPSSLLTNRLYTQEFYQLVKNSLAENSTFAITFYFPTNYQSREVLKMGQSIYTTFDSIFENNAVLVLEDQLLLIGEPAKNAPHGVSTAKSDKLQIINLQNTYPSFTPAYLQYQLTKPTRAQIINKLKTDQPQPNSNIHPVSFLYQSLFWLTTFSFSSPQTSFYTERGSVIAVTVGFLALFIFLKIKKKKKTRAVVAVSSFILISLQTILIYLFQTRVGNLYSQIALLFSLVLLGMGAGIYLIEKKRIDKLPLASKPILYLPIMTVLLALGTKTIGSLLYLWWMVAVGLGFCGGIIFAGNVKKTDSKQSKLYTADLIGAGLGAFFTGTLLFPTLGLVQLLICLTTLALITSLT